jgi:hypothetical protein
MPLVNDPASPLLWSLWSSWLLLAWAGWFVGAGLVPLFRRARPVLAGIHAVAPLRQDQRALSLRCVGAFLGAADWCACAGVCREWNAVFDWTQSQAVYAELRERCNGQAYGVLPRRLARIPPERRRTAFRFMREQADGSARLPPLVAFSRFAMAYRRLQTVEMVAALGASWPWPCQKAHALFLHFVLVHELAALVEVVLLVCTPDGIQCTWMDGKRGDGLVNQVLGWSNVCCGLMAMADLWPALVHVECFNSPAFLYLVKSESWQWQGPIGIMVGSYLAWHARSYQILCGCAFLHRLWASANATERATVRMALVCAFVAVRQGNFVTTVGLLVASVATHDLWHCCQLREGELFEPPQRQTRRARLALAGLLCALGAVLVSTWRGFP